MWISVRHTVTSKSLLLPRELVAQAITHARIIVRTG
jgi:hypothetical protein